ncbi:hypothetical protein N9K73_03580 [Candidatus Poseidoniales archaeon]|nr:hypothetical protein [Candidatus Poseidoniales archaeon]
MSIATKSIQADRLPKVDATGEWRRRIRHMQVEWHDALEQGVLTAANREGLEARAFRLLSCSDEEWMQWLDDLDFWKTGWKPAPLNDNEA